MSKLRLFAIWTNIISGIVVVSFPPYKPRYFIMGSINFILAIGAYFVKTKGL